MSSHTVQQLSPRASKFLEKWSVLIGPEYAQLMLPIRRWFHVGLPSIYLGVPASIIVLANIPNLNGVVAQLILIIAALVCVIPMLVGVVMAYELGAGIQHDLQARGFTLRWGGPPLLFPLKFPEWCRVVGISSEGIIATGHDALGAKT